MTQQPRDTDGKPKTNPVGPAKPLVPDYPPPEEDLGGGDICSLEDSPSTDDDRPLP